MKQPNKIQNQAFTLVELIVVITILAILGTIAFIALQEYPLLARNGKRIADIGTMQSSLEIFQVKTGVYPTPSDAFTVSFSGATAWEQGGFGESVFGNVGNLSTLPVDPLTQNEYTYSITHTGKEYQIGGIQEGGSLLVGPNVTSQVHAATIQALVEGNYNGQMLKVQSGPTDYILAVPTILTSDTEDVTVEEIITRESFVVDGLRNIPATYVKESGGHNLIQGATATGGVNYSPASVVVYTGDTDDLEQVSERETLATNLQTAYRGSDLESIEEYSQLVNVDTNNATALVTNAIAFNNGGISVEEITQEDVVVVDTSTRAPVSTACVDVLTQEEFDELNSILYPQNSYASIADICAETFFNIEAGIFNGLTALPSGITKLSNLTGVRFSEWVNHEAMVQIGQMENITSFTIAGVHDRTSLDLSPLENLNLSSLTFEMLGLGNLNNNYYFSSPRYDCDTIGPNGETVCIDSRVIPIEITLNSSNRITCGGETPGTTFQRNGITYTVVEDGTGTYGIHNAAMIALINPDDSQTNLCTSNVTDMSSLFEGSSINEDLNTWDVSNVTNMYRMFADNYDFNGDISSWNTRSVTNMSGMFADNVVFNQDISEWDVSNVTNMNNMFSYAYEFNQDIGNWDVSNVTNMGGMFSGGAFNQDIGNWDVSNVTHMAFMFSGGAFNQDIGGWDTSNVVDMNYMFYQNSAFNQDISNWDVSNVTNMVAMFLSNSIFNQDLSGWCVTNISSLPGSFHNGVTFESSNFPVWGTCP